MQFPGDVHDTSDGTVIPKDTPIDGTGCACPQTPSTSEIVRPPCTTLLRFAGPFHPAKLPTPLQLPAELQLSAVMRTVPPDRLG